jgi:hypothetical protein
MSNAYVITDNQTSNYNGMQAAIKKRLSRQFSLDAFYIWSKTMESGSLQTTGNIGNSAATEPEDYYAPKLDKQRADNDIRSQFSMNAVWKPVFFEKNRYLHFALDGWSVAAIVSLRSGRPFAITTGTDDNFDGDVNDRPNILPGQVPGLSNSFYRTPGNTSPQNWFNTSAYCKIGSVVNGVSCPVGGGPAGVDGLLPVNSLNAPNYHNVDASIFRDFTIYERLKFQFRGEATNVFNIVNLNAPNGTLNNAAFGKINSAAGMRVLQVGGRLLF